MMDYYDTMVSQRGEREALAIAVDDARKLRRHLSLIRLIAAMAGAVELIREGCKPPLFSSWKFERGWIDLLNEMRLSSANQALGSVEAVRVIAVMEVAGEGQEHYARRARELHYLLRHGFIPPDPSPDEMYEQGWRAACEAFRDSEEVRVLSKALADFEDELADAPRQAQGRTE